MYLQRPPDWNASVPGDVADLNVPVVSAVALDSAVAKVISAIAVVMDYAVSGVSVAGVVLTAIDVPGVPAVARVSVLPPPLLLLTSHLLLVFPNFLGY
jgi:hypothetical protein